MRRLAYNWACLDQLLIILCDHIRSKTRLIAITSLIAMLHQSTQRPTVWVSVVTNAVQASNIQTRHREKGRWGVASQLQQQHTLPVYCWPPLIDSRNGRPSCRHLHDKSSLTAAHNGLQIPVTRVYDACLHGIKASPLGIIHYPGLAPTACRCDLFSITRLTSRCEFEDLA